MGSIELTQNQLNEALKKLFFLVPLGQSDIGIEAQKLVICHSIASKEQLSYANLAKIKKNIKECFGLDFEEEEIDAVIQELVKENKVISHRGYEPRYSLEKKEFRRLNEEIREANQTEREVFNEWITSLKGKYPLIDQFIEEKIKNNFLLFCSAIFAKHGAECAYLIYGKKEEVAKFIEDQTPDFVRNLPSINPEIDKALQIEFPKFFLEPTQKRKLFIAQLLDNSFLLHVLNIDKTCSALMMKEIKDKTFYLDTNFIFRLLGLDGDYPKKMARCLLEICKKFENINFLVSKRTIDEFLSSLDIAEKNISSNPIPPKKYIKTALELEPEEGFVRAYWREYYNTGVSIDDFFNTYRQVNGLLREIGIEISDEFYYDILADSMLRAEALFLKGLFKFDIPYPVAEHDSFNRFLIQRLRGRKTNSFLDTEYWFLTCDNKLPIYGKKKRKKMNCLFVS